MISLEPKTLVSSFGGVATTTLLDFLARIPNQTVNPASGFRNPLKHPVEPPALGTVERAVFLFGCPSESLLSLFRRENAALHYANINGLIPDDIDYPTHDSWRLTVERFGLRETKRRGVWADANGRYASDVGAIEWLERKKAEQTERRAAADAWLRRTARKAFVDFDDYLDRGVDQLRREEQMAAWQKGAPAYPVMLMRYETLWNHLDELFDFLEVPGAHREEFPPRRARQSSLDTLDPARRDELRAMHAGLSTRVADELDWRVVAPNRPAEKKEGRRAQPRESFCSSGAAKPSA